MGTYEISIKTKTNKSFYTDYHENHEEFDKSVSFSIERVSGIKLIRKYRKSYLINDYLENNKNIECLIADHWKSLELIKTNKKKSA